MWRTSNVTYYHILVCLDGIIGLWVIQDWKLIAVGPSLMLQINVFVMINTEEWWIMQRKYWNASYQMRNFWHLLTLVENLYHKLSLVSDEMGVKLSPPNVNNKKITWSKCTSSILFSYWPPQMSYSESNGGRRGKQTCNFLRCHACTVRTYTATLVQWGSHTQTQVPRPFIHCVPFYQ